MGVILEIRDGPMAGKVIGLKTGETVTVGRAAGRAEFALPHDTFMSGVHFAVECGTSGCRVQDRKSSNGTFLNGARIQDAMLANGDEIKGGQTIFAVKIVADAKLASLLPPQEVAPPPTPQQRSPDVAPLPPSAPAQRPRAAEPAPPATPSAAGGEEEHNPAPGKIAPRDAPAGWPRTTEPDPAAERSAPAQRPRAAESVAPAASASAPVAEVSLSAARPAAENPLPVMRTADLDEAADAGRARDAGVVPPGQRSSDESPPPAQGLTPKPEAPARSTPPPEPPRFHAIPRPPVEGPKAPPVRANPPNVGSANAGANPPRGGENPPGVGAPNVGANRGRPAGPPPGVAPYIAEKFAERPGARGAGLARGVAFSVMGWSFPATPAEWQVQEGFGLQQSGHEDFPSSVAATEELLGGITLQQFVESQISMLRGYLRDPKIEPTMPPRVGGADESMAVDVRHSTKDGRELVYRRIYARSGSSVGVLTVTTLAADLPQVLQSLQPLLEGAAFRATVHN
jgi:pSer/pThr/pTyr-binding forkhead associated (FHA) protein